MKKFIASIIVLATPMLASAQLVVGEQSATGLVKFIQSALNTAVGLLIAAAVVWFLWGVFKFIMSAGDSKARDEGRSAMIYGIIGLAVMVSVWGLVRWVTNTAGTSGGSALPVPVLPTTSI